MQLKWKIISFVAGVAFVIPVVTLTGFYTMLQEKVFVGEGVKVSPVANGDTFPADTTFNQAAIEASMPEPTMSQESQDVVVSLSRLNEQASALLHDGVLVREIEEANATIEEMDALLAELPSVEAVTPESIQAFEEEYDSLQQEIEQLSAELQTVDAAL